MSIQVVCPNGHTLTVSDSCAGKSGLCPVCKAAVKVPQPDSRQLSGDAALGFSGFGKSEPARAGKETTGDALSGRNNSGQKPA
jgi:hypothetical protein